MTHPQLEDERGDLSVVSYWSDTRKYHYPFVGPSESPASSPDTCLSYRDGWPDRHSRVCGRPGSAGQPCRCTWPRSVNVLLDDEPMTPEQTSEIDSLLVWKQTLEKPSTVLQRTLESKDHFWPTKGRDNASNRALWSTTKNLCEKNNAITSIEDNMVLLRASVKRQTSY